MNGPDPADSVAASSTLGQPRRQVDVVRVRVGAAQRLRIISAMVALASENGAASTTVTELVRLAGVSRKTFYELFEDRGDCMLATTEHALALACERAEVGYRGGEQWIDGVRGGLEALLQFFDEKPQLARICIVQSAAAGPAALARRGEALGGFATVVDEGRALARHQPPPLTAEGIVGGVVSVVTTRLLSPEPAPLLDLVNPLMSAIVLPYRGQAAARKQLTRPVSPAPSPAAHRPTPDALDSLPLRLTHRTMAVLSAISAEPGLTNLEVSERAGIGDQGQISKLLARLSGLSLTENTCGQPRGTANRWHLTRRGQEVHDAIGQVLLGPGRTGSPVLPSRERKLRT